MNGTGGDSFSPAETTTRGMAVKLLYNLDRSPETAGADFPDVEDGAWYSSAAAWAVENGIAEGYEDGSFGPDDAVTREQLAVMLCAYAELHGMDTSQEETGLESFGDVEEIHDWALPAVRWACARGLMNGTGDGMLSPGGEADRAQTAALLERFLKKLS